MKKPLLIVIAGPNGSGKTSTTMRLIRHAWAETCEYINPDEIAQQRYGDWNNKTAILQAVEYAEGLRESLLKAKRDMIFETVLSSEGKVDFIKRAKAVGYFVRLFFISTASPVINAGRVAKRVMEGGHDVPIEKIISRYQKSINNARILVPEIDRAYFYDNSIDNAEAQLLFRTENGVIVKQYAEKLPEWVEIIYQQIKK